MINELVCMYIIYIINTLPHVHRWWLGEFLDNFQLLSNYWPLFFKCLSCQHWILKKRCEYVRLVEAVPQLIMRWTQSRSFDITPMHFFCWGYVKDCCNSTPVPDISTLRTRIQDAILTKFWTTLGQKLNTVSKFFKIHHVDLYW